MWGLLRALVQEFRLRVMENKMETTIVYWGYIGIMEKKMETTIVYWVHEGWHVDFHVI